MRLKISRLQLPNCHTIVIVTQFWVIVTQFWVIVTQFWAIGVQIAIQARF